MRAVVVGAVPEPGQAAFYSGLLDSADLVVGADAGAAFCLSLGHVPHVAVGDFDSCGPEARALLEDAGVPLEVHPRDKDASDLDLAVATATSRGADEIVVTAAFRGRPDHTLAAFGSLSRCLAPRVEAHEPDWRAWSLAADVRGSSSIEVRVGAVVSLLSPGGAAGVSSRGLRYPLRETRLEPLASLGLSNVATESAPWVEVLGGDLIVLAPRR